MIARHAQERPDALFLVEASGGRTASYAEFWRRSRQWATLLHDAGITAGDRVVSLLPGSIDAHAAWIGASLLGAWEVPVNPDLKGRFLDHALTSCEPAMYLARPEQVEPRHDTNDELRAALAARPDTLVVPREDDPVADREPHDVEELPGPREVSCVIHTSGTTGAAKGVVISWGQLATTIGRIPRSWLGPQDAVYSPWPMFHVTGRSPLFAMADTGGTVVLRERFSRQEFWPDIDRHGCTVATAGTVAAVLLSADPHPDDRRHRLRHAFLGTGPTALAFVERFGVNGISCYGSTELGFAIANPTITPENCESIGWLRPGYEARVVDDEGNEVTGAEVGELLVRPPTRELMFLGYLDDPAPASIDTDGWFHTGDSVARHSDGRFVFAGRIEDTIRRFGENISTIELERAIIGATGIARCAVVSVPAPVTGADIVVCVAPEVGHEPNPAVLHEHLRRALPRYMVPTYVCVVDDLPVTPTGKVRRRALLDQLDLGSCWAAPG